MVAVQPLLAVKPDDGSAPVVKISFGALPPPFTLSCTSSRGLPGLDLSCLPHSARVLEASCLNAHLKVGRSTQPPAFWASLLPDEALRHAVAPEHFEVAISDEGEVVLTNLSSNGTLVNGKRVAHWVSLESGDNIAITHSLHDHSPVICFRLAFVGEPEEAAQESCSGFEAVRVEARSAQCTPFDSTPIGALQYHTQIQAPYHTRLDMAGLQAKLTPLDGSMPAVPIEGKVAEGSPRLLATNCSFGPRAPQAAKIAHTSPSKPAFGPTVGLSPAGHQRVQQPLYHTQPLR